jgi:hypothetical protein
MALRPAAVFVAGGPLFLSYFHKEHAMSKRDKGREHAAAGADTARIADARRDFHDLISQLVARRWLAMQAVGALHPDCQPPSGEVDGGQAKAADG